MSATKDNNKTDDDQWLRGLRLLEGGEYWEAHEAWEQVWLELPGESAARRATKALIQLAAILYKAEQAADGRDAAGMQRGMERLVETSRQHLEDSFELSAPAPEWSRDALLEALNGAADNQRDWVGGTSLPDIRRRNSDIATTFCRRVAPGHR